MSSEKTDFFSRKKKKKEKSNVFRNWEYREIFILRFLYFGPVITSWFSIPSSDSNWWRCSPWPTCSIFENFKTLFFSFFFFLSHGSISFGPWLQCSRREVFHPEKKTASVGRSLERRTWNYGRTYLMGPIKNSEVPRTLVSLSPPASERSSCWSPVATIKRLLFKGLCFY